MGRIAYSIPLLQPDPGLLRHGDWRLAMEFVNGVAEAAGESAAPIRSICARLKVLAACEVATLSVCHLDSGHRSVQGDDAASISAAERECFDRHFDEHPLVQVHGWHRHPHAQRISDLLPGAAFRRTALYADYYARVGIDHVIAIPMHQSRRCLVSCVLNRAGRDFSDREAALLDQVRRPLARLLERGGWRRRAEAALTGRTPPKLALDVPLTAREREVLGWVAAGKTDRDVAAIVGISPRTVHKHLQHIYDKLGVETRTAAVMRALG